MKRVIQVVPHNPRWAHEFEVEATVWRVVLGAEVVAVHHIGSTAIPGIGAKPIVDMLVIVRDIERVDGFNAEMVSRGYVPRGENGIAGRRYFIKGTETHRTHHVHAFAVGHPEIARHLEFRDYMIAHPEVAQEYDRLKQELAAAHRHDIDAYVAGKDGFIREALEQAHIWAESRRAEQAEQA